MNDSFLEDLGLVQQRTASAVRDAERFITTRCSHPSKDDFCVDFEKEIMRKQVKISGLPATLKKPDKSTESLERMSKCPKDSQKSPGKLLSDPKSKRCTKELKNVTLSSKPLTPEKKAKVVEKKLKAVEYFNKLENVKAIQGFKCRGNRLVGFGEITTLSDGSSKENSRPSDSSGDGVHADVLNERPTGLENLKIEAGNETMMTLNTIKEIVSTCTKVESNNVMRMMQDLYINSQSNMIKQLMCVTDDLKELNLSEGSLRFQVLIKENYQLLETVAYLRSRVDELQKGNDDLEKLRQENLMLRAKIREFEK